MRHNKSEAKWQDNKINPVDGRHVLNAKAVKHRVMSQRPNKPKSQHSSFHIRPGTKQNIEPRVIDSIDGISHLNSYKGSQLRVVQSNIVTKPKVPTGVVESQLHSSHDPNFSD
jgi:hypothetical protein